MKRTELSGGITRIILTAEDAAAFSPVAFEDAEEVFLTQTGFSSDSRPVYRLVSRKATERSDRPPTVRWSCLTKGKPGR